MQPVASVGVLRTRNFRLFWTAEGVSVLGDQAYVVALPWIVLQVSGSAVALGTVLLCSSIPRAALMLGGGALSDRLRPRILVQVSNVVRGAVALLVGILALTGELQLWELYLAAVLFGIAGAAYYPAFSSMVPSLVGEAQIPAANSVMSGTFEVAGLAGPAAAGAAIGALTAAFGRLAGSASAYIFDAGTFFFSGILLALIRPASESALGRERITGRGLMRDVVEGLRYGWAMPGVRGILAVAAAANFAFTGPIVVGLAYVTRTQFHTGAAGFGILLSALAAGSIAGTLVAGRFPATERIGPTLVMVEAVLALGLVGLGAAPNLLVMGILLAVMGVGNGYANIVAVSWLQRSVPRALLGRVMSLVMLSGMSTLPLSYLVAGLLVQVSPKVTFVAAGILLAMVVAVSARGLLSSAARETPLGV